MPTSRAESGCSGCSSCLLALGVLTLSGMVGGQLQMRLSQILDSQYAFLVLTAAVVVSVLLLRRLGRDSTGREYSDPATRQQVSRHPLYDRHIDLDLR